ncbi:hypothetical protein [Limosilactobacillus pontis]|uniref:hypothetical protein n=1 Tax=Limosilactobacillus pontis TaxID=35787 RepID=UPI002F269E32
MIKEYRKKTTIKAEQFDGSAKMARKYGGKINPEYYIFAGEPRFVLPTKKGGTKFDTGDWIVTGIGGEHWAIADSVFRHTYEEVE